MRSIHPIIAVRASLKVFWSILIKGGGVLVFNREPTVGDSITVGKVKATFFKHHVPKTY